MTNSKTETTAKKQPALIAYVVTEREGKKYWNRRGAAWPTKDGKGFTVVEDSGARYVLLPPKADQPAAVEGGAP
jgi:hypothetical protein